MATSFVSVGERYDATRARMLRMLEDLEQSGRVLGTAYARPGRDVSPAETATAFPGMADELAGVMIALGRPDTGVAAFWETDIVTAVVPPFPIAEDAASAGLDAGPLRRLLGRRLRVAVVMIRLGRYAVGVLDGETLVASKTDTRYVKSRHRAGGSSQRRFERSRERLVARCIQLNAQRCPHARLVHATQAHIAREDHEFNAVLIRVCHVLRARILRRLEYLQTLLDNGVSG